MALPGFLTDPNTASIIAFIAVLAVLVWRDRKNIERHSIVLVRRTKKGIHYLDRIAGINPRLWRWWASVGVVIGFGIMAWITVLILFQTVKLFLVGNATPPVGPVLPTVSTTTDPATAGYWGIPFWPFIAGISVVMVVHETMHGVLARAEDFAVEYVGVILLAIIPGAFVQPEGQKDFFEPDADKDDSGERQSPWDQGRWTARLRVLAAGPAANITVALLLGALLFSFVTTAHGPAEPRGVYQHEGMRIVNVTDGSPAAAAGLQRGMVVTAIGGNATMDIQQFTRTTQHLTAGTTVTVETAGNGSFAVELGTEPGTGQNQTFRPAPVDYLLPRLEQAAPGTITRYEAYNNWITGYDAAYERARWQWIAEYYPSLRTHAREQEASLETDEPAPGHMGIFIVPERDIAQRFAFLAPFLDTIMMVLYGVFIVAALNLMIGAANLLPVKGLDGGWMLSILLEEHAPQYEQRVTRIVTVLVLAAIGTSFAFLIARALG